MAERTEVNKSKKQAKLLTGILVFLFCSIGRFTYQFLFFIFHSLFSFFSLPFFLFFRFSRLVFSFLKIIFEFFLKLAKAKIEFKIRFPKIVFPSFKKIKLPVLPKRRKKVPVLGKQVQKVQKQKKLINKAIVFVFTAFVFSTFIYGFYEWVLKDLPDPEKLVSQPQPLTTKLYDRKGRLLYKIYRDQNRTQVDLNQIPDYFINATISIEDKHFFDHNGFSLEGIFRAAKRNIFNQKMEGGSTITQQLVKNTLLTPEKTMQRKIKELVLSFQTELMFDKNEILIMYLNTVPYGGTAYGVEEASQTYFNKSIKDLSLSESALLAGLPAAPSKYSPFGSNPELSILRQHEVLRRMVEDGYVTPFEAEQAKSEKLTLAPIKNNIRAPHFTMYLKDWLTQEFGLQEVEQGGLTVTSSLDLDIQEMAEKAIEEELIKLKGMNVSNGAAMVINPQTGEILAMVGSKNYYDTSIDGNVNIALQLRQPGSTIKVINYAYALDHGYTAASIISDTPISYRIPGQPAYSPVNYDHTFHGNVTLRKALACSYNVPAVKVLASFGTDKMIWLGQEMGITTWTEPQRFGLSLTLGGGDIRMVDLSAVYAVFANGGKKADLSPILKVEDYNKESLLENQCIPKLAEKTNYLTCLAKEKSYFANCVQKQIIKPEIAYLISSILSDNNARTPAFGANSLLNIKGHQVAVKTGTTNDKRDNWCIGYTGDYLTAVWVGNNDNKPMSAVASGITGATPIWHSIMSKLLEKKESHLFEMPLGIKQADVCNFGNQLCLGCKGNSEYFLSGTEPTINCSSETVEQIRQASEALSKDQILEGLNFQN